MSLTLYYHPFSSYCFKALIALYENGTPFTPRPTNLYDPESAAQLKKLWPIGKFPVLHDAAVLGPGIIDILGVIDNVRDADCILAKGKEPGKQENRY